VVESLLRGCQGVEGLLNVRQHVFANGHDEERVVGQDSSTARDGLEAEASVAFFRNGADLIVLVAYYSGSASIVVQ
jgi:hypothetical protein